MARRPFGAVGIGVRVGVERANSILMLRVYWFAKDNKQGGSTLEP